MDSMIFWNKSIRKVAFRNDFSTASSALWQSSLASAMPSSSCSTSQATGAMIRIGPTRTSPATRSGRMKLFPGNRLYTLQIVKIRSTAIIVPDTGILFTLPFSCNYREIGADGLEDFSKCEIYDGGNKSNKIYCPYGWEYDRSDLWLTIPSQFNWVCNQQAYTTYIFTSAWISGIFGKFVFGPATDRFGNSK